MTPTRTAHVRVKAVLMLSLVASMAANVLAAQPTIVGRTVAAWFPLALLLVIEVLSRAPRSEGWLGLLVSIATGMVALAAAVASFSHMREVALAAGESELVAVLFPLTVDGLAVVCSAALVELGRRERSSGELVVSVEDPELADSTVGVSGSQRSLSDDQPASAPAPSSPVVSGFGGSGFVPVGSAAVSGNGSAR